MSDNWRLADSLDELRDQVNERWPRRSKASDGTIGDAAHATRDSDHNPWVRDAHGGVVTAIDLTDDGDVAEVIVATLVRRRDRRVKYVIFNRRIWRSYAKPGIPAWTPAPYSGRNAHSQHVHVSVKPDPAFYDSRADWGIVPLPSRVDEARDLLRKAWDARGPRDRVKIAAALEALEGLR